MSVFRVLVLMSTYNGERYLEEQLQSILDNCNDSVSIEMIVRDDGSSDTTKKILDRYKELLHICLYEGTNLKPAQSFRKLVELAPLGYDAYAFADQDDIWDENKIKTAVEALHRYPNEAALWYCGIVSFKNNCVIDTWCCDEKRAKSLKSLLCTQSSMNGCTMVFNSNLIEELKACAPGPIDMHDSWANLVCLSVGGRVLCESRPMVRYRIHEDQVTGENTRKTINKLKRVLNPMRLRSKTAENLLTNGNVVSEAREIITKYAEYKRWKNKIYLLCLKKPDSMSENEFLKFKIQLLLNAY